MLPSTCDFRVHLLELGFLRLAQFDALRRLIVPVSHCRIFRRIAGGGRFVPAAPVQPALRAGAAHAANSAMTNVIANTSNSSLKRDES